MTLPTETTRLNDLIDYQAGSIVSKVLLKGGGGSVTLFAFAAGESLSEHTAPFNALLQVIDGTAEVGLSGVSHQVDHGAMLLLPANEPHSVTAVENFKMILTMIREQK